MPNLYQTATTRMKQMTVGDNARPHIMINHHRITSRAPREAPKSLCHRPGANIMLNVNRYASVPLQRISQRHLFDIFVIRHPVHNAVFGIDNAR